MKIAVREALARKLMKTQEVAHGSYSFREMAEKLLSLTDEQFGKYAFLHEPLERKFSEEEKLAYILRAKACGTETAAEYHAEPGPGLYSRLKEEAADKGVTVTERDIPVGGGHVIFAEYTEPAEITIYTDCITRLESNISRENAEDILGDVDFSAVLLAHELFHAEEYVKRDSIFTQTERIELWKKPFSNRSRILALSEIAAMSFAKTVCGLHFSPYALDVLLIDSYDHEAACALYEEILRAAKDGKGGSKESQV